MKQEEIAFIPCYIDCPCGYIPICDGSGPGTSCYCALW